MISGMRKPLTSLALVLVLCHISFGCDLDLAHSPTVRSLHLGMTRKAVVNLYSYPIVDVDSRAIGMWDRADFGSNPTFENVQSINLLFDKANVLQYASFSYIAVPFDSIDAFADNLSEILHLPKDSWVATDSHRRTMRCKDFMFSVGGSEIAFWLNTYSPSESTKTFKP
jgi:hypothetical protein